MLLGKLNLTRELSHSRSRTGSSGVCAENKAALSLWREMPYLYGSQEPEVCVHAERAEYET